MRPSGKTWNMKKSARVCICCPFYVLRLWYAHWSWTDNAEASRRTCHTSTHFARAKRIETIYTSTRHLPLSQSRLQLKFARFLWWKSRDKSNELIVLVISAIVVIDIAVIFLLLTRFSQKVHLLYPWLWTVGRGKMLRSVNGDFQIIIPRIIFAQIIIVWQN